MSAKPSIFTHPAKIPPTYEQLAAENYRLRHLRFTYRQNIRCMQRALEREKLTNAATSASVLLLSRKAGDLERHLARDRGTALGLAEAVDRYRNALSVAAEQLTHTDQHAGKLPRQILCELLGEQYPPLEKIETP